MELPMIVFTSGKGGVGKTPYALLLAILMRRMGKDVLVMDYNFLNPDLFEIYRRMGGEKVEVITEVDGERLVHPLVMTEVYLPNGGKVIAVARKEKFRYLPYPPFMIFQTAVALQKMLKKDVTVIVDTNLNIPSFNVTIPEMTESARQAIGTFGAVYFAHIWSMGGFRRGRGHDDKSEIELVRSTVKAFSQRNIALFGRDGERIIHIFTPRMFGKPSVKSLKERFSAIMKSVTGKKEEVVTLDLEEKDFLSKYIDKLAIAYERSNRYLTLAEMLGISDEFDKQLGMLRATNPNYLIEADPFDLETMFLSFMLERLYDRDTMTMPLNAIIVPYMIKKLVNFVDVLLISEFLEEDPILARESPATEIMRAWVEKVLLKGKI